MSVANPPLIPVIRQAINAAQAVGRWVRHGLPLCDTAEYHDRLATCRTCEHYSDTRCRLCGCFFATKLPMRTESCPADRWRRLDTPHEVIRKERRLPPHNACLNASAIRVHGRELLAWRSRGSYAKVAIAWSDELPDRYTVLEPPESHGPIQEDPRLLALPDGRILCAYHAVYWSTRLDDVQIGYCILSPDLQPMTYHLPKLDRQTRTWGYPWEKNWAWFCGADGLPRAVTCIVPHTVARVEGDTAAVEHVCDVAMPWPFGHLSGGAIVPLDDCWLHIGHSHYHTDGGRRYVAFAYTFDREPPYQPRTRPVHVLGHGDDAQRRKQYVIFPGGVYTADNDSVVTICGIHDEWIEWRRYRMTDVLATCVSCS